MFGLFMQQMRLRALRRLPIAFGWLTMRGDTATTRWVKPVMQQPEIRREAAGTPDVSLRVVPFSSGLPVTP